MKRIIFLAIFVIVTATVTVAQAEVKAGSFSLAPFIGGYVFENNQDLKDSIIGGLRLGYNITENVGVEAFASFLQTEVQNVSGEPWENVYGYGIEALYHFSPESRFVPFVALGVGGTHYDVPNIFRTDKLTVDYGAGMKIFMTENIALRAEVRHVIPLRDNYNDLLCTLGMSFTFGGNKKEVAEVKVEEPPAPVEVIKDSDKDGVYDSLDKCPGTPAGVTVDKDGCPVDSDKDGVADYLDKCPDTPAGVAVDKDGCPVDSDKDGVADYLDKCPDTPAGVAVDKDGCPVDSDKDGVADYLDKCPDTPAGVAVDKDGCPVDSDKDGVADYLDKCPDTPAGVAVDKDGCPVDSDKDGVADYLDKCPDTPADVVVDKDGCLQTVVITLNVEFDTAKAVIKDQYSDEIKKVADFMKQYPWTNVVIEGHTDNVGDKKFNKQLSEDRAGNVRQYLIDKYGIEESRITAVGYGLSNPIASNDTEEGRQKNRRVQAFIETVKKK